jgi:hypothetical protein
MCRRHIVTAMDELSDDELVEALEWLEDRRVA